MISLIQRFVESQPQNPEFRNNPEIFHPCIESQELISSQYKG